MSIRGLLFPLSIFAVGIAISFPHKGSVMAREHAAGNGVEESESLCASTHPVGKVEVVEEKFNELMVANAAAVFSLGGDYIWSEGPVWIASNDYGEADEERGGTLLISDIPRNRIVRVIGKGERDFLKPSGYTGMEKFDGREPGSNGLALDPQGRLVMCCHGDRNVTRIEKDGSRTVLADRYEGKRFNSPNDLVYDAQGNLYFTDPPYGLQKGADDPGREIDWCGVYRLAPDGAVTLVTKELNRPNGIGLSPDGKTLYVGNSERNKAIWMAYPLAADGTAGEGRILFDASDLQGDGSPDGFATDAQGNLWASGPGGILVISPAGKLLGRIRLEKPCSNCCFGDQDGRTLYMTVTDQVVFARTKTRGRKFKE